MRAEVRKNFNSIKTTIESNLETIRALINQAEELNQLVETLEDGQSANRDSMKKLVKQQFSSIDLLIKQTNDLFDLYYDFLSTMKKK